MYYKFQATYLIQLDDDENIIQVANEYARAEGLDEVNNIPDAVRILFDAYQIGDLTKYITEVSTITIPTKDDRWALF